MLKRLKMMAANSAAAERGSQPLEVHAATPSGDEASVAIGVGIGQSRAAADKADTAEVPAWAFACRQLLRVLLKTPNSAPFRAPVKGARGYKEVVEKPMDFGTIAKKLGKGDRRLSYANVEEFAADMRLVFSNCFLYNKAELQTYPVLTWAKELREVFEYEFEQLHNAVESPTVEYYPQVAYEYTNTLNRLALCPNKRVGITRQDATIEQDAINTCVITDECCNEHDVGKSLQKQVLERPARLVKVMRVLKDMAKKKKMKRLRIVEGVQRIPERVVMLAHDEDYIIRLKDTSCGPDILKHPYPPPPTKGAPPLARQLTGVHGDTFVVPASFTAAMHAASCVCTAVDMVVGGKCLNAFCAIRPPGHHAGVAGSTKREEPLVSATGDVVNMCGQGFCLLNNVGIGAKYALHKYPDKIKRVVIVDWDLHHGNGTQEICEKFSRDENGEVCLLFLSVHAAGKDFFPCTGSTLYKSPCVINVPVPLGSGREAVVDAFTSHFCPAIDDFNPDLVMISAGFDMHHKDLMGSCKLESSTYKELTWLLRKKAEILAQNRLISVMEGGYNVNALGECVSAHVEALWSVPEDENVGVPQKRASDSSLDIGEKKKGRV